MKFSFVMVAVAFLTLLNMSPAAAVSRAVEAYCLEKSEQALLPYRRSGRDAFLANCRADFAATPGVSKKYLKKKYRKAYRD